MKITFAIIIGMAVVAITLGQHRNSDTYIMSESNDADGRGNYKFSYQLSDGSSRTEEGRLQNEGTEFEYVAVTGVYSYIGDDGQTYTVQYRADEGGFQPVGAHIPK